jgi:cytosine deaminase
MGDWHSFLNAHTPEGGFKDEAAALRACELAAWAADLGTYGVGAVLLDEHGEVIVEGHNEVYVSGFRSDLHAEMVVVNKLEASGESRSRLGAYTLVTSLEPCPMCMTRLIFSGIGTVLHVAEDPLGGMVQRRSSLPPIFRTISEEQGQVWGLAECSPALRAAAFRIWSESRPGLDRRLTD